MRSSVSRLALSLALCFATLAISRADTGRHVALIVGIGAYRHIPALINPLNDAGVIADTLAKLGFNLVGGGAQINLDKAGFDQAVRAFGEMLVGAEVGLFYYAGHGLQVQGTNWLVPTGADPTRIQDLDFQMVDANLVLRQMDGSGTRLNILILDACRNNPFGERGLRGVGGGLAHMRAPEGTIIAYATQPGNVARDGEYGHSPFSDALAKALVRPGLDVFRLFNQVGLEVKRVTGGQQQPWMSNSPIDGDFYFASVAPPFETYAASAPPSGLAQSSPPPQHAMLMPPLSAPTTSSAGAAARMIREGEAAEHRGDYSSALTWYRRGADLGDADAAFNVGWVYQNGLGVPINPQQAFTWYSRAAGAGHLMAANNLGVMYKNGLGVDRNYAEALYWYRKAADGGNTEAQNNLGVMYNDGLGITRDPQQAMLWFTRAAAGGNVPARVNIAFLYQNGISVPQNYAEAMHWFRQAADAGNGIAALNIGLLYENGLGVAKDHEQALIWIRKAAAAGSSDARNTLQALGDR